MSASTGPLARKLQWIGWPGDYGPDTMPAIIKLARRMAAGEVNVYTSDHENPFLFETDRLIIRRFTAEDAEGVQSLAMDRMSSSMRDFDHPWPTDREGCAGAARWFAESDAFWAVCLKPDLNLIGFISMNEVNEARELDLGHIWHTAYWGKGLDTEALGLMVKYAFDTMDIQGVVARNPLQIAEQIAPLTALGMTVRGTGVHSFVNDSQGNPVTFEGCELYLPRPEPDGYGPRTRPVIIELAEVLRTRKTQTETCVEQLSEWVSIVDRVETKIIGIGVPVNFESRGYGAGKVFADNTQNDYFIARKYISDGTVALLAAALGLALAGTEIVNARYDIHGDGNYKVVVGLKVDSFENLPVFLPEHTVTFCVPAGRFVKMLVNEKKLESRAGYPERMHADEYFIGDFRRNTPYMYDKNNYPLNTYDETGDMLAVYEPIKIPAEESKKFETFAYTPVLLPPMKIACCISGTEDDFVIMKYFDVQDQVFATGLTDYYLSDYYGFPVNDSDDPQGYKSCFGSRVTQFDGLPDCVERVTLPGGLYVHITQLEANGDNPSMSYDVAFNHMDTQYFSHHPEYAFDWERKVIARFRQALCASVFVPIRIKE